MCVHKHDTQYPPFFLGEGGEFENVGQTWESVNIREEKKPHSLQTSNLLERERKVDTHKKNPEKILANFGDWKKKKRAFFNIFSPSIFSSSHPFLPFSSCSNLSFGSFVWAPDLNLAHDSKQGGCSAKQTFRTTGHTYRSSLICSTAE